MDFHFVQVLAEKKRLHVTSFTEYGEFLPILAHINNMQRIVEDTYRTTRSRINYFGQKLRTLFLSSLFSAFLFPFYCHHRPTTFQFMSLSVNTLPP